MLPFPCLRSTIDFVISFAKRFSAQLQPAEGSRGLHHPSNHPSLPSKLMRQKRLHSVEADLQLDPSLRKRISFNATH